MNDLILVETDDGNKYIGKVISSMARFPYSDKTYMILDYDYYYYLYGGHGVWFPYSYDRVDSVLIIDRSKIVEILDDIIVTESENELIVSAII